MGEVYTGKIAEDEMLGPTERERFGELSYKPYSTSMEIARRTQPYLFSDSECSPSDPEASFANDLHATIAEKLGLDNYDLLRYYTALDTELDRYHGVDAFFELYVEDKPKPIIITIDLTFNPHKDEHKADIVIFASEDQLDVEENKEGYSELVENAASKIANAFQLAQNIESERRAVA